MIPTIPMKWWDEYEARWWSEYFRKSAVEMHERIERERREARAHAETKP